MEIVNDSLKNVSKAIELLKQWMDSPDLKDDLFEKAIELLEKSQETLASSLSENDSRRT